MQTTQVFCLHFVAMTVSKIMSISNLDKKPSTLNQDFHFNVVKCQWHTFWHDLQSMKIFWLKKMQFSWDWKELQDRRLIISYFFPFIIKNVTSTTLIRVAWQLSCVVLFIRLIIYKRILYYQTIINAIKGKLVATNPSYSTIENELVHGC